jgi:glucose uptake protein
MTLPTTYMSALLVTILGLIALGTWINTLKLAKKWRYELFYFDFAIGAFIASVVVAFTLGTFGSDGFILADDFMRAGRRNMAWGMGAGMLFNLGFILLIGTSTMLGIVVAFPLGFGTALIVSSLLHYITGPEGNTTMVFTGIALAALATVMALFSYRSLAMAKEIARMKAGEHRTLRPSISWKGIFLCVLGGVLMGVLNPLITAATTGDTGMGPYSLALVFSAGMLFSTVVYDMFLMNLPLAGRPLEILDYFRGKVRSHLLGILGGAIWAGGMIAVYVAASAPDEARVAAGTGFAIVQAVPLIAALWGLVVWKEFATAGIKALALQALTLFLYAAALVMLALAPFSPMA